ncbi:MAG TPA: winged helix-turn-helix transcriptional regulator [Asanoa sp.]|nr:winged helix-turn-helix transcriptional regulator [Asanoa sp.]
MTARVRVVDETCGVAQAAAVMGDWWNLLVMREVARGHHRFDALVDELQVSRRVLTERLAHLVDHGVLVRRPYQERPTRYDYRLTPRGEAFLPVLVGMQDWADRWLLGDGTLTATAAPEGAESDRVRALVGSAVPAVSLTSARGARDVLDDATTVLFTYPATGSPNPHPAGWGTIDGAIGCTLENRLFRDRWPAFESAGIAVHGVSTQRPEEQAAFAAAEDIPFPLLSDVDLALAAALRLPTVRIAQQQRLKRLVVVVDRDRVIRHTIFPVTDIPAAVEEALTTGRAL